MRRLLLAALIVTPGLLLSYADAGGGKKKTEDPKEALQAFQDFIGSWSKGTARDLTKKLGFWTEKADWSWRFKGKDAWIGFKIDNGKAYKEGEVRYLPDKSKYQLTLTTKDGAKHEFLGEFKKVGASDVLTVERTDADSGDTEQLKFSVGSDGDRLVYSKWLKPDGRTQFKMQLEVGYTREGVTFGIESGGKKVLCVVTGGLGTMPVSYMGVTYYVCCSGCRDAFNENPKKIIDEYNKKKKK